MKKELVMTGTGDALYVASMPKEYDAELGEIADYIGTCDVRMTNLESNIEEFGDFAAAESGGTWINTPPADFDDLMRFGFNYYGTGNNHAGDFSTHGVLSTIDELDRRGLAHSGTGKGLEEAGAHAVVECGGQKVGIIAFTCDFNNAMKAGYGTPAMKSRPGVNYVRSEKIYPITKEEADALEKIAKKTYINAGHEAEVKGGFALPEPEGIYFFGGQKFCYDGSYPTSRCNKADLARITKSIEDAKKECDYVVVLSHCHAMRRDDPEAAPEFLEELCHACIDAGAAAVIGGGKHQLRGLEIYHGAPIFYSLGDFIYQGMRVHHLPADFMIAYGVDKDASAWEGLMARSQGGKIGLQTKECNFLTVLPRITFEDGKMKSMEMMPLSLGFEREGNLNGLPYHAKGDEGKKIFDILNRLSKPYGTELTYENDMIVLK